MYYYAVLSPAAEVVTLGLYMPTFLSFFLPFFILLMLE